MTSRNNLYQTRSKKKERDTFKEDMRDFIDRKYLSPKGRSSVARLVLSYMNYINLTAM